MEKIYTIENFYENPHAVREQLRTISYANPADSKNIYPGIDSEDKLPDNLEKYMIDKLIETTGAETAESRTGISRARVSFDGDRAKSYCHSDREYMVEPRELNHLIEWTVLVYLSLPQHCMGGLEFLYNKTIGSDRFPINMEAKADLRGVYYEYEKLLYEDIFGPDEHCDKVWKGVGRVPMKFNQGIIFPSHYFHRIYDSEGFGSSFDNCRLISVGWFHTNV